MWVRVGPEEEDGLPEEEAKTVDGPMIVDARAGVHVPAHVRALDDFITEWKAGILRQAPPSLEDLSLRTGLDPDGLRAHLEDLGALPEEPRPKPWVIPERPPHRCLSMTVRPEQF